MFIESSSRWSSFKRVRLNRRAAYVKRRVNSGALTCQGSAPWRQTNTPFLDEAGKGKKSDVLAVHLPSGKLGIVECKDDVGKRDAAVEQLGLYGGAWARDGSVLAPFFNTLLHAMARVYAGDAQVPAVTVSEGAAAQFFAWPRFGGMAVERVR